jgi:hypothetical protein
MSKSWKKSVLLVTTLITLLPLLSGCIAIVAAGAGAGAYAYIRGGLDSHLSESIEVCIPAVRSAMSQMDFVKIKETSDIKSAKFIYRDALDTRLVVTLHQKQDSLTAISIRVGRVGDESRSIQILNSINNQL